MQLINGRTPEQWAAYDRAKLIGAVALALLLVVLWLAGFGPTRAAGCCGLPAANTATEAPPAAPRAGDAACASALDSDVLFATDSAELTPQGRSLLDRLAPCWRGGRFEVEGHTDASGTDAVNQPLSERRAAAVVDHLVARGIEAYALTARGYGSSRPVADNATPEGRARNRRVEFRRVQPSPDR
jgi:outer membrane protein OmpA-like peptidoglycan-associated protein